MLQELFAWTTPPRTPVDSPLHKALEQAVQDVAAVAHQPHVLGGAVNALPVQDGPLKHVAEFLPRAQEVRPDKVHHAPVLDEVVLQRVPSEHHPPARADVLQSLRSAGMAVLYPVSFVTNNHIWAGARQSLLNPWGQGTLSVRDE